MDLGLILNIYGLTFRSQTHAYLIDDLLKRRQFTSNQNFLRKLGGARAEACLERTSFHLEALTHSCAGTECKYSVYA